ncbi:MAG: ribonuclease E/G [Holosporales bacterium]|jgi:ribonuclease E|nr:ribonuclease E/G [Holosporales bacterium]
MSRKMFIDAVHPEDVRVAVTQNGDLKEFESENTKKVRIKGNIYLAKVVRIEPSIQAIFVDCGLERNGFLGLNEIHPDYYQIPTDDKKELERGLAEIAENADKSTTEVADLGQEDPSPLELAVEKGQKPDDTDDAVPNLDESITDGVDSIEPEEDAQPSLETRLEKFRARFYRKYKVQEVIRPGQILLVQIVKEERGSKCAALTTHISLAGRYCVFMPNTRKPDGISRRISDQKDRERVRAILDELKPSRSGCIVIRTAGTSVSADEIKNDYKGLEHIWNEIRETTVKSTAPCLIHEEESFAKRIVRDLYAQDTAELLVDGKELYQQIKQFMESTIPEHAKRVKLYKNRKEPLFVNYKIDEQIERIYQSEVPLKSGGYLVIHSTEALIAVDVNSGRARRERNMEETALRTNLEAVEETARQMRLRDLAGLIVIDLIDMKDKSKVGEVEKKAKEALAADRSRVYMSKISQFGLLEISRERRRPSITEGYTVRCPHCLGSGVVKSLDSVAMQLVRELELELSKQPASKGVTLNVLPEIAAYVLNHKKKDICALEEKFGACVVFTSDVSLNTLKYRFESASGKPRSSTDKQVETHESNAGPKSHAKRKGPNDKRNHLQNTKQESSSSDVSIPEGEQSSAAPRFALAVSDSEGKASGQEEARSNKKPSRRRRNPDKSLMMSLLEKPELSSGETEASGTLDAEQKPDKSDGSTKPSSKSKRGWWNRILK